VALSDLTSFDGTTFASIGVTGQIDFSSAPPEVDPTYEDRVDTAASFTVSPRSSSDVTAIFKHTTYAQRRDLRRLLGFPRNRQERVLVASLGDDASPTSAQTAATVAAVDTSQAGQTTVIFRIADVRWLATSVTTDGPTSFSATGTRTLTVGGETIAYPTLKVGWSVARPSSSATIGWTFRRRITITNSSVQALRNYPVQLGPINTATLTSGGKLQVSANDLVVFDDKGRRLRHGIAGNTNGANNRATFLWWVIDELAAGASRTYDVAYGNPSASGSSNTGFPLSYPGSPSIDTTGVDAQASAGSTTTTLNTPLVFDPNQYVGSTVIITGDSVGVTSYGGQYRRITSHTTSSGILTISRAWTTTPNTTAGFVVVGAGFMGDGGQASSTTATSLTDSSQVWNVNEWIGATVEIITLSITMGTVVQSATVTGNTATALTVASWPSGTPSGTALYRVYRRNGNWLYRVSQDRRATMLHRGRWRLNPVLVRPSQVWFKSDGSPAAWSLTTYNPNDAKNDVNQRRYSFLDTGGSEYDAFAILDASIQYKDRGPLPEKGYANGCELYVPLGILGTKHDFQIKNPSAMARAAFGVRERGGEDWNLYKEYSTTQASLTLIAAAYYDLTAYGTPLHLLAALTSDDDADIEKTQTGTANLRDGNVLEVRIDTRNLSVTNWDDATEDTIYDLSLTVRRGGASEADGDDVVVIGGDERHVFLKSTEKIWIGPIGDRPLAIRTYAGSTYVRDVANGALVSHSANDATGTVQREVSSDVLPLTPGSPVLRISDTVGSIGTVNVQLDWNEAYL
jgi:hypothetical protein